MSRNFYIGDIHGNIKALKQVLERSGFDYENDKLVTIGDLVDGWAYVYEVVEELLKIKNRIDICGNHDFWNKTWLDTGIHPQNWNQGGEGTLRSYVRNCLGDKGMINKRYGSGWESNLNPGDIPESHQQLFRRQIYYYVDDNKNLFVHGGINRHKPIKEQDPNVLMWDRDFWSSALQFHHGMSTKVHPGTGNSYKFQIEGDFKHIYIGHTSTENWSETKVTSKDGVQLSVGSQPIRVPMHAGIVTNGDTGAGWSGPLTIINTDNGEFWQSDTDLYPGEAGRGHGQ